MTLGEEGQQTSSFCLGLSTAFSGQPQALHLGLCDWADHSPSLSLSIPLCKKRRLNWVILRLCIPQTDSLCGSGPGRKQMAYHLAGQLREFTKVWEGNQQERVTQCTDGATRVEGRKWCFRVSEQEPWARVCLAKAGAVGRETQPVEGASE